MERDETDRRVERAVEEMHDGVREAAEHRDELEDKVRETRQEWERKREDSQVPGADPAEPGAEVPPRDAP